ncbi:hypothetical protein LJC18_05715, partial [Lachnospiraceae bacterium OttesenSCG-928-E19]|nr:hypothetical protein [Lachnospiraceae bacterium OttesenSCG-928-E19]
MIVGIVGAGAWGTALAILSARSGNTVVLWSHSGNVTEFEGVEVPSGITVTRNMNELIDTDCWLIATPARYFRKTIQKSRDFYDCKPIIICSKG